MNIQSMLEKDSRHAKSGSGGYEWWYFDAISEDGKTEIVVIFYEGNPFSRRYINRQKGAQAAAAEDFPAISITMYHEGETVYYSFTEVAKEAAFFGNDTPRIQIEDHNMEARVEESMLLYELTLNEKLASGDQLHVTLTFQSSFISDELEAISSLPSTSHFWQIVQPRASVSGNICCRGKHQKMMEIPFKGTGYHDHNWGGEPLKNQFEAWYWGRFYFNHGTFIYYLTGLDDQKNKAWLLSPDGASIQQIFSDVQLQDKGRSFFGLRSARRITFEAGGAKVMVQQRRLLDNGPFYQRFSSDAFLHIADQGLIEQGRGLSEYLEPPRIYNRWFWPLTNMRIRYKEEKPHWVQRSSRLYRWTW